MVFDVSYPLTEIKAYHFERANVVEYLCFQLGKQFCLYRGMEALETLALLSKLRCLLGWYSGSVSFTEILNSSSAYDIHCVLSVTCLMPPAGLYCAINF